MSEPTKTSNRKCACVSDDAAECLRLRYPDNAFPDPRDDEEQRTPEKCECCCHERQDGDEEDWELRP